VATLIEKSDAAAFRRILPTDVRAGSSPANRVLLPGSGSARKEIAEYAERSGFDAVLMSHAFTKNALTALMKRDTEGFVEERSDFLEEAVDRLADRLAAWSQSDRPSIAHLLQQAGAED
jgi:hypothetical protein